MYVVRLSVSTMSALVHSIVIDREEPAVSSLEFTNSSPGFFRSDNHFSSMENIAISDVVQNLFFNHLIILRLSNLSHSKYSTQSTMCSSVFGHARFQSLFICHMINTAVFVVLAYATSSSVIYLTWDILPEVQVMLFEYITLIESITTTLAGFFSRVLSMFSMQDSDSIFMLSHFTPSLFALSDS